MVFTGEPIDCKTFREVRLEQARETAGVPIGVWLKGE